MATKSEGLATMIAEAAYFAAERRNFLPGNELSDWLVAEQEIAVTLGSVKKPRARPAQRGQAGKAAKKTAKKTARKTTAKAR